MFFEQLLLAGNVPAIAFCQHVLAQGLDVLAGDDVRTDRGLDRDVVLLARDLLAHLRRDGPAAVLALHAVHDDRQRVDAVAVDQQVDLDDVRRPVFLELVVHRRVAARDALQLVEEVEDDLGQRDLVREHHLAPVVRHVELHAALLHRQRDHRADVVLRHVQVHGDDGLADLLDAADVGHLGRILDQAHRAVVQLDLVDHAGRGRDQVLVELALQALLHDLHVQQAQEAAAEAEAQRLADLGLVVQRAVVELELLQRVAQLVVLAGFRRIQAGEHLRLDLLEAGQRLGGRAGVVRQLLLERDGVAHLGGLQLLDAADDEAHLAGPEHLARQRLRREHAQLLDRVDGVAGHHAHAVVLAQHAVDHAHQHHDADVVVEPAVDDHRARRRVGLALGRRHAGDHGLEDLVDAHARLGGARDRVGGVDADDVLDFLLGVFRIRVGQIHLVQHRHHLDAQFERGVAVGHRLRLDALARVDHQQRAFTRRQRTADLVREVDVSRRVDQVQVVRLAVLGHVFERRGLGLDRDAALALDVHRIEHLGVHLAVRKAATTLDDPVGQRALAVVDVGNDREVSDVIHEGRSNGQASGRR